MEGLLSEFYPKTSSVTWLGARETPGQFMLKPLCPVKLVIRWAGAPSIKTVKLPRMNSVGPITSPDATPMFTPALSPFDSGIMDIWLSEGIASVRTVRAVEAGLAVAPVEILGYGIGTGPTGVGVRHTSGIPSCIPPPIES